MLPLDTVNSRGGLTEPEKLKDMLMALKEKADVDGVMVDIWWGLVENAYPKCYDWRAYRQLFEMLVELQLKLQVVMSFHGCGGNVGDDVVIPLPEWILEVGATDPDIFFTDGEGRRNKVSPVLRCERSIKIQRRWCGRY